MNTTYRRIAIAALLAVLAVLAGCASPQTRADRAFDEGEYQRAFSEYKELIDEGTDDWQVYYRAAQAATHLGNFAVAEKWYGRALRQGGGAPVAREFANFYLKTSNYSRAVRLLQFLLEVEEDKQPIYNNIGTALMYAGAPLDAETYLLIAQQMEPDDPLPYVNLGVLYERHLRQPDVAVEFYRCYLKLAEKSHQQRERIQSRVSELGHTGRSGTQRVECGNAYYKGGQTRRNPEVDKKMEELESDLPEDVEAPGKTAGKPIDLGLDPEVKRRKPGEGPSGSFERMDSEDESEANPESSTDDTSSTRTADEGGDGSSEETSAAGDDEKRRGETESEPTIDRAAESSRDRSESASGSADDGDGDETSKKRDAVLKRARAAYGEGDYQRVVDQISRLSLKQLNLEAMRIYGLSLAELGENDDARQWLEWVVDRKPNPGAVGALLEVYDRLDRDNVRERICKKFRERDDYEEATESCASSVEKPADEKLEKLRMQRKQQNQ